MKILVATDGSIYSEIAQRDMALAGLSQNFDAIVLSVADVFLPPDQGLDSSDQVSEKAKGARARVELQIGQAQEIAEEGAEFLTKMFPASRIHAESMADSPGWGIIKRAEEWNADLIVLGSRGRSGVSRLILGSVSQKVLNHSHCAVRIARLSEKNTKGKIKLVLGTDGSAEAKSVTDVISSRHWPDGTEVEIIAALSPRLSTASISILPQVADSIQASYRDEEEWMRKIVKEESEKLKEVGLIVTEHIVFGDPKQVLVDSAETGSIDCIFVGARGLTGIKRFLIGSVSSAVSSRAYCSVEVVRQ